jgi:CBS domain containing-hemolysin-like protein
MPDVGDQIRRFGFDFTVLSIRPQRIARAMIDTPPCA